MLLPWHRLWFELVGELVLIWGSGTHRAQEDSTRIYANVVHTAGTQGNEKGGLHMLSVIVAFSSPVTSCHIGENLNTRLVEDLQRDSD